MEAAFFALRYTVCNTMLLTFIKALREVMNDTKCHYCGSDVEYAPAAKVYRRAGFGFLYLCKGFPACDAYVSAGDDGKPMGTLANRELREQRKRFFNLVEQISAERKMPRHEVLRLIGRTRGVKVFRVNDLRERDLEDIFSNLDAFIASLEKCLIPTADPETTSLKLPLRYLFIESHSRPAGALPYQQYRGHLKVLNEAAKLGLVNKITKRGTRSIFWVLTQPGKTLIDYDMAMQREATLA